MQDHRMPEIIHTMNNREISETLRINPSSTVDVPDELIFFLGVWLRGMDLTRSCLFRIKKAKLIFGHELGMMNNVDK